MIEPCPLCGDPMRVNIDRIEHVAYRGGCLIHDLSFDISQAAQWNTRARPVASDAMVALEAAAKALLDACYLADANEELAECIDGSLLDALSNALDWRYPVIWSPEQVAALNASQEGYGHPFTCGGNRTDDAHRAYQAEHGGDFGQLVATKRGWVCPSCDYRQSMARK